MRKALVWGFDKKQSAALSRVFESHGFRVEVSMEPRLPPGFSLHNFSVVMCNLDNESVRGSSSIRSVDGENHVLLGICSPQVFKSLDGKVASTFFDILKKPLSSVELRKKIQEANYVVRLRELARTNSVLFDHFDEIIDLYSFDDPYRVMERLLEILTSRLDARGGIGWMKGVEAPGKYIMTSATGEVEMRGEPSAIDSSDAAPAPEFPRNELVETDVKAARGEVVLQAFLDFQGDVIGIVKVFVDRERYDPLLVRGLHAVLRIAAAALHSTSRLERLRRSQLIDTEMRVYNLSFFRDYLDKEIQKAHRFRRVVSVLFISVENYPDLKRQYRSEAVQASITRMLTIINSIVRSSDVISKIRDDRYAVVLSETDYYGALTLKKRLLRAFWAASVSHSPRKEWLPLKIVVVEATYPRDGLDYGSLMDVGERRIEHVRGSVYAKLHLEDKPFLVCLDEIFQFLSIRGTENIDEISVAIQGDGAFLQSLKYMLINEIARNPSARGVLYVGEEIIDNEEPFYQHHHRLKNTSTKVYLIAGDGPRDEDISPVVPVYLTDESLKGTYFLVYVGELGTYCTFLKAGPDGAFSGFHSTDSHLVENLVVKLEDSYVFEKEL